MQVGEAGRLEKEEGNVILIDELVASGLARINEIVKFPVEDTTLLVEVIVVPVRLLALTVILSCPVAMK